MTTKSCKKEKKKHTPIVSEKQRGLFGAELARKRAGKSTKTGMSEATLKRHLEEAGGKKLPEKSKKSAKGSKIFTEEEINQGYRKL